MYERSAKCQKIRETAKKANEKTTSHIMSPAKNFPINDRVGVAMTKSTGAKKNTAELPNPRTISGGYRMIPAIPYKSSVILSNRGNQIINVDMVNHNEYEDIIEKIIKKKYMNTEKGVMVIRYV